MPDEPVVKIRPSHSSAPFDLRELWNYRELLYFLTWRDLKVRYKQTILGVAWAVIQPLFTMVIFTLFFGRLAAVPSDGVPYPIFVYSGLLLWTFFSNAVANSGNSLVGSANLLSKVYFPRMLIPWSSVAAALADLAIAFIVLVALMLYYRVAVTWRILMIPVPLLLVVLMALGVGMWLSALNVKYRDVRFAIPFVVQLWMFMTPIIYPSSFVPDRWRWLLALNPLTGIIDAFRVSLFGHQPFQWPVLGASTIITLVVLVTAAHVFWRMEESFADVI